MTPTDRELRLRSHHMPRLVLGYAIALLVQTCFGQQDPTAYQYEDPAANVEQISGLIGITPVLAHLQDLKGKRDSESLLRSLLIRQQILELVQSASLQVDATIARIEGEVAQANEYRAFCRKGGPGVRPG